MKQIFTVKEYDPNKIYLEYSNIIIKSVDIMERNQEDFLVDISLMMGEVFELTDEETLMHVASEI
jgi:hypothetical protein